MSLPTQPDPVLRSGQPARHRAALAVICVSALVVNVDNTILNVALPTLVRQLHATSSELQWIVDSYAMVFAGLLLVGGSLADRFGRKRFFLIGLAVFAASSAGAGFSGSVSLLIAWRALMGMGAALTIPASLSIINDVFRDPTERARAIGAWAGTIGLGIAIGPIAGGLLLARFWWGAVFLVNVPIIVAGFLAALALVPDSKNPAAEQPDPAGGLLSVAGFGLLLWAIIEAPTAGWASGEVIGVGLASLVVLGSFAVWEARSRHPMLKLELFGDRHFSVAAAGECLGTFGLLGALFVQTQFLQFDLGYSPLQAGLRILPIAVVLVVTAPSFSGPGSRRRCQTHRRRGSGRHCRRAVADLCRFQRRHYIYRYLARHASDRPWCGAAVAHGDELGRGLGAPRRRGGRIGFQRRGSPSRGRARRCRVRKRARDPIPRSHGNRASRPVRAARRLARDPRVSRWRPWCCGPRGGTDRCLVGTCCPSCVHERQQGVTGRRCGRRARGCPSRTRRATVAWLAITLRSWPCVLVANGGRHAGVVLEAPMGRGMAPPLASKPGHVAPESPVREHLICFAGQLRSGSEGPPARSLPDASNLIAVLGKEGR